MKQKMESLILDTTRTAYNDWLFENDLVREGSAPNSKLWRLWLAAVSAGYQAAIADVKAGGAYCAIEWTTGNKIETYKLPEDEK